MTTARRRPAKATATAKSAARPITKAAARSTAKAAAKPAAKSTTKQPTDAIVLTGPPGLLRATVSVENAVDQRVAVRGLTLHRSGQQALAGAGGAVIAPGATAQLPVSFRREPDTPPRE